MTDIDLQLGAAANVVFLDRRQVFADGASDGKTGFDAAEAVVFTLEAAGLGKFTSTSQNRLATKTLVAQSVTVTVEHSDDGSSWTAAADAVEFATGGTATVSIDAPKAHMRVSWALGSNSPQPVLSARCVAAAQSAAQVRGGSSAALLATKEISSAEILGAGSTPIVLVAAPGPGKIVVPLFIYGVFRPGATPYTFTGGVADLKLSWGSSVPDYTSFAFNNGQLTATDPTMSFVCPIGPFAGALDMDVVNVFTTEFEDKPIVLYSTAAPDGFADGDGTATMNVLYSLLSLT